MKTNGELRFDIGEGEYHTFDSYYRNVVFRDNCLIIPYVNMGIYAHPLNPMANPMFLNKCYIVLSEIAYFKVYKKNPFVDQGNIISKYELFFGGANLDPQSPYVDMDVRCNRGYLQIFSDTVVSTKMWIPIDTPNLKANMKLEYVDDFFNCHL